MGIRYLHKSFTNTNDNSKLKYSSYEWQFAVGKMYIFQLSLELKEAGKVCVIEQLVLFSFYSFTNAYLSAMHTKSL